MNLVTKTQGIRQTSQPAATGTNSLEDHNPTGSGKRDLTVFNFVFTSYCKGLFTWREGVPANRATRLGGLKHSPPLHASDLGEIVGRAAVNHNKQDGG